MLRELFAGMIMSSCTLPQYFTRAMLIGELAVRLSVPVLESKFTLLSRAYIFSISYKYMLSDNNRLAGFWMVLIQAVSGVSAFCGQVLWLALS